ncbi:MAG TPA: type II toxin-antitoxin system VapC family toxin [Solirubrobacterales bacterium]|nr:type II toxin-antitoxin system VapC family toxin [Solirubrobacterales bacterium]
MTVVLDSNVAVALALDAERAPTIEERLRGWEDADEALHAPSLFRFEVANALTRNVVAGKIDSSDAKVAWQRIAAMEISLHGLTDGPAVIGVARKLKRESAYDAAYIVLAQELEAELWTLDGPLARNAAGTDLPVRLIETK